MNVKPLEYVRTHQTRASRRVGSFDELEACRDLTAHELSLHLDRTEGFHQLSETIEELRA